MKVIFINTYRKEREIGEGATREECFAIMNKFLEEHHFKSYYVRTWKVDDGEMLDVGSHSEFFKFV